MKFKVGDKVRFVKSTIFHTADVKIGETYKIIRIDNLSKSYQVENAEVFNEEELVKADYTYEDLKKAPIGTKITFEDGKVLIKTEENRFENRINVTYIGEINNHFKHKILGKIIKIEEPTYTTVYEAKKEILDEAEKRYLKQVIRPFRKQGIFITKIKDSNTDKERIVFDFEEDYKQSIFPAFDKNTMYEGMKLYNHYTLEELGLKE